MNHHAEALETLAEQFRADREDDRERWRDHMKEHKDIDVDRSEARQSLKNGIEKFKTQDEAIKNIAIEAKPMSARVLVWSSLGIVGAVISAIVAITIAFGRKVDRDEHEKNVSAITVKLDRVSASMIELSTEFRILTKTLPPSGERMSIP